ncbi:glycoside hydrolase family 2 TIM barrel-domain containing protein [Candidatus Latescibacterota bacterium]
MNTQNRKPILYNRLKIKFTHVSLVLLISIALLGSLSGCGNEGTVRSIIDFNYDWHFMKGEQDDSVIESGFDDSIWESVRLPHDWAITGPFDADIDGSTGKLPWRDIGWYRKMFTLDVADAGKRVYFDFDGVMAFPVVYINGQQAGSWDYGYVSFRVDVTPYVNFGGENTIAVRADTRLHFSRWYPGAGIYRKVTMAIENQVHIAHWGTYITTPEIGPDVATVDILTSIENHLPEQVPVTIETVILDPSGRKVASTKTEYPVASSETDQVQQELTVKNPRCWDIDDPAQYTAKMLIRADGMLVDEMETTFGFRTFEFTSDDGFYLNGRRVQIHGVNLHHDQGPLGAAFNTRAMERQLEIMQDMGVNAIRTSHNPPAPELLDLCDRMGLIVWDECFDKWDRTADHVNGEPLDEFGEKQYRNFILRDRNHPSIVTWSIGNEIADQNRGNDGKTPERVALMSDLIRKYDPTRPISYASNDTGETLPAEMFEALDLIGWNYGNRFSLYWHRFPDSKVMYSESAMATTTRGFYELPLPMSKTDYSEQYQLSSYDRNAMVYGDIPDLEFHRIEQNGFSAGEFVWTGFDYLGEPTPFSRKGRSSYCGTVDLCGIPKDRYWLYRSHWRPDETSVHILPHWNWPEREGQTVPVYVYTNGDEAELFLNGESLGRRAKEETPVENQNLALGQPASASSTAAGAVNAAMNATDGSFDTAWTAAGSGIGWLQVDLGEEKEVRYINVLPTTLHTRPGRPMFSRQPTPQLYYTVQTSVDGASWRNTTEIPPDIAARRYEPSFAVTGTARYVRVVFTQAIEQAPGIREIEVYRYDIDEAYYFINRRYRLMWEEVSYAPGELRAVAYKNGERIGESVVRTAGKPAQLSLTPDRADLSADGYDLSYILVEASDSAGTPCPFAENLVTFDIEGPAEISGVGNGNPLSFEPFQADYRHLFYGKAMLIIRTNSGEPGHIRITAKSEGLEPATVTLRSK